MKTKCYFTVAMYAEECGITPKSVYTRIHKGEIKPYYGGGLTWIDVTEFPPKPANQGRKKITTPKYI